MLKPSHEVIGEADEDDLSARLLLPPLLNPEIEHIVKIDVGQQWANTPALNCPYLAPHPIALFQHAGLEPFLDQAHDAPVGYAMLDKFHQPPVIESVIELADVGIEHPVHFSRTNPDRQRIQRFVRTTPWSEPIRKSQEVLFIDCVQHLGGGALNNLVFQRWNSERAKLARFTHLLDVNSAHRLCSVGSSLESMGEILEVRLEVLNVVLPCLAVHSCSCALLNCEECRPQSLHIVDMVEERSEPLFPILPCCLTYPLKRARRVLSALSPGHVTPERVPLGQPLSLHCLRHRFLGFVRQLRRYFGAVRLPTSVHH